MTTEPLKDKKQDIIADPLKCFPLTGIGGKWECLMQAAKKGYLSKSEFEGIFHNKEFLLGFLLMLAPQIYKYVLKGSYRNDLVHFFFLFTGMNFRDQV